MTLQEQIDKITNLLSQHDKGNPEDKEVIDFLKAVLESLNKLKELINA